MPSRFSDKKKLGVKIMKKIKKMLPVLLAVIAFFVFSIPALADGGEVADGLMSDFEAALPEDSPINVEDLISHVGFDAILSEIVSSFRSESGEIVSFFLTVLGIALSFSIVELGRDLGSQKLSRTAAAAVSAIAALLVFSSLNMLVSSVAQSLSAVSEFFSGIIPVMTGVAVAGGAVGSAAVQGTNMNIALGIINALTDSFLLPMVFMIFALALAGSVGGDTAPLAKGVRSVFVWGLGIVSAVFIAAVSMQSILASAQDTAALRAAKHAVSGSIPIVGSTVSGALATLSGALSYVGARIGVASVAVLVLMAVSPLLMLLLYRVALSLAVSALEFVGAKDGAGCLASFRGALDAMIAVYVVSIVIYIMEIFVFMKCGVGILE